MENKVLKLDTPYNPRIESIKDFSCSAFADAYETACHFVNDINENQNRLLSDNMLYNLIPIIGDRGSGKTSIMLTLKKYFEEYPGNYKSALGSAKNIHEIEKFDLKNTNFITLKVIDAAHFEKSENLLGVVLARMLGYYNELLKDNNFAAKMMTERSELYNKFSSVYKNLINSDNMEIDFDLSGRSAVRVLQELDTSHNLKSAFTAIVEKFLSAINELQYSNCKGVDSHNRTYVVISIDDLDMNIESAHKMMQQIQSYMMIPKVIVMFTSSYDNLSCICMNNYASFFKEVIHASSRAGSETDKRFLSLCESLSKEYINKFLPTGKKIHLYPTYDQFKADTKYLELESVFKEEGLYFYSHILSAIILRASGIYMYSTDEKKCFLEPDSIRAKAQYIHKIKQLKPVLKNKKLKYEEIAICNEEFKNLNQKIRDTLNNLDRLIKDMASRYTETLVEPQRRRLDRIVRSSLRNISSDIYFLAIDLHVRSNTKYLLPADYNRNRDIYSFSNVLDVLDSLEQIMDVYSYKNFISASIFIFTLNLVYKKYEKIKYFLDEMKDESKSIVYGSVARNTEFAIFTKYIGSSLFGWLDNQLVRPLIKANISSPHVDDDGIDIYDYIGFSLNINQAINWYFDAADNNFLQNDGKINFERMHAIAMFLMFLSSHHYEIKLENNIGTADDDSSQKNPSQVMKLCFTDNIHFSISSYFVNICRPGIVIAFYIRVLKKIVEMGNAATEAQELVNKIEDLCKDLEISVPQILKEDITKNEFNVSLLESSACDIESEIVDGIIPMLNVGFMYNIARELRKKTKRERTHVSAWDAYCEYFFNIGAEFVNIDKYYDGVNGYEDKKLFDKYIAKVPKTDQHKSFFSFNDNEKNFFNQLISSINWQYNSLNENRIGDDFTYDKTNRTNSDDFQKAFY